VQAQFTALHCTFSGTGGAYLLPLGPTANTARTTFAPTFQTRTPRACYARPGSYDRYHFCRIFHDMDAGGRTRRRGVTPQPHCFLFATLYPAPLTPPSWHLRLLRYTPQVSRRIWFRPRTTLFFCRAPLPVAARTCRPRTCAPPAHAVHHLLGLRPLPQWLATQAGHLLPLPLPAVFTLPWMHCVFLGSTRGVWQAISCARRAHATHLQHLSPATTYRRRAVGGRTSAEAGRLVAGHLPPLHGTAACCLISFCAHGWIHHATTLSDPSPSASTCRYHHARVSSSTTVLRCWLPVRCKHAGGGVWTRQLTTLDDTAH